MTNRHELKQLQTRLAKAEAEYSSAREETRLAQRKESLALKDCTEIRKKIEALEEKEIILTEHAMLRYFERVLGFDLEKIRDGLVTKEVAAIINEMKTGKIPAPGCRLVVSERVIVTLEV